MNRVVVGISGGVDSAVAAAVLKEKGYEVIGVTFKFIPEFDATDAIEVSKKLQIEHHVIDYQKEFKDEIINNFLNDYKSGITPNPCVLCNKKVKLKFLYDQMLKFNCDYIATGHYARVENSHLYKGKDEKKDQSYFLCEVPKDILNKILFPLENIEKEKTRELARKFNLDIADKKDSTDVCFINKTFKEYIRNNLKTQPGKIIDIATNKVLGEHDGLANYTIGQRRGLNIGGTENRLFVAGKNTKENILYVTIGDDEPLLSDSCIIENVNYLKDEVVTKCSAKFRYHAPSIPVEIEFIEENTIRVKYPSKVRAVTPGQICALYIDDECIGGGVITKILKNNKEMWYL